MTANKNSPERTTTPAANPAPESVCRYYIPEVDVLDGPDGILLRANMPGVDESSVDVTVENEVLTLEGRPRTEPPQGLNLLLQEREEGGFRRSFELSERIDTTKIKAKVRNGVLEVTLPRREEAKVRRIEIAAG